ncbi:Protein of unknown function [Bacillus mycoides]
MAKVM